MWRSLVTSTKTLKMSAKICLLTTKAISTRSNTLSPGWSHSVKSPASRSSYCLTMKPLRNTQGYITRSIRTTYTSTSLIQATQSSPGHRSSLASPKISPWWPSTGSLSSKAVRTSGEYSSSYCRSSLKIAGGSTSSGMALNSIASHSWASLPGVFHLGARSSRWARGWWELTTQRRGLRECMIMATTCFMTKLSSTLSSEISSV